MIQRALKRGVPKERLARALNVNVGAIQLQQGLLKDICPEAVEILKDKFVAVNVFRELRKMVPLRQIEAAELMMAANRYSHPYAKALLAATPSEQMVATGKPKKLNWLNAQQISQMEHEAVNHAKIGVSISGEQHFVIFGDMNQQGSLSEPKCGSSQNGRGGLFFVLDKPMLYEGVKNLITGETAPTEAPQQ